MADIKPFGGATGAVILATGVAIAAGAAWYAQRSAGPDAPAASVEAPKAEAPAAAETPAKDVAAADPAPKAPAKPEPPRFDTVRVTPEGDALVAGRAAPGAEVSLRLDGKEIARATVDPSGAFVSMFDLPTAEAPRTLDLVTIGPDAVASAETVVLAPTTAPEVAATAEPAEGPTAEVAAKPAEAPTALLLTDQGATVLQGAPQAAPGSVAIVAIAYTPDGAVQLSGAGTPGASVRLYLNNQSVADALVAGNGTWVSVLRNVAPGLYQLRADQMSADGKVTARFETPFQRETPAALAAAMKPSAAAGVPVPRSPAEPAPAPAPVKQAVNLTVQPGFTLWQIARETYGEGVMYVKVFDANKAQIRDPDLIYPGQVFTIPDQ